MKQKIRYFIFSILTLILCLEIILRTFYGFCDAVLMVENIDYEYIAQPNQNRQRFGNKIIYNQFSMRSEVINPSSVKILGFGDSVINGGNLTDQDSLATTLLSDSLTKNYGQPIQFLNISAGSWGPDNCFAYLKNYGNFNAKYFFLFVSSHDAYDNMNFEKIIGINKSYPNKQYPLAIYELLDRYVLNKITHTPQNVDELGINKRKINTSFNSGFKSFFDYSIKNNVTLIVYLHAEKKELMAKKYNPQGEEIIKFCNENNIALIKDLDYSMDLESYRDNIHVNNRGQKKISNIIQTYILKNGISLKQN